MLGFSRPNAPTSADTAVASTSLPKAMLHTGFALIAVLIAAMISVSTASAQETQLNPAQTDAAEAESDEADPIIAKVGGHEIKESELYRQVESLPLGDQIGVRGAMDAFLRSMVREEIFFQAMLKSDFLGEPELRDEVKSLVAASLINKYVKERATVSAEAVQQYYNEHERDIRGEHVQSRQILLKTRAECEALLDKSMSEAEFTEAAKRLSLHKISADRGGDLGLFMPHAGPLGFEPELFSMKVGEQKIFETAAGCHLILLTLHEVPPLPPLAEVEERIRSIMEGQREIELLRGLIDRLAVEVEVEVFETGE